MNKIDMTSDEIKKAREIIDAATPGPWEVNGDHFLVCSTGNSSEDGEDYVVCGNGYFMRDGAGHSDSRTDASFIAAAREGWPKALSEIERLTELTRNTNRLLVESDMSLRSIKAENQKLRAALEGIKTKLQWIIKPDHIEDDAYTQYACAAHRANEALGELERALK